ncbi:MAG: FAD-dependent oxidoreductase [Nitrospira sp.]|nr:FAD-dependent oxidoreductase [Nitrospira sp.]
MTAPASQTVLILGAGLAGLTVAYHLRREHYHVTLLDHPEWRDGFWLNPSDPVPVLLGCYRESHRLLHALNRQESPRLDQSIPLEFRLSDGRHVSYQSARLPGAFRWMMSLFSFQGLAWQDRWRLFSHVEQIWEQAQTLPVDLENRNADEWLAAIGQSLEARERVWGRLAHWLTGNDLARLSAATFVHLLSTIFLSEASDARLTSVSGSIEERFLAPMKQSLPHDRIECRTLTDLPLLRFDENRMRDVRLHDGTTLHAQWYILALPHQRLRALLPERLLTRLAYFAHMPDLTDLGELVVQVTCRSSTQTPRLVLLTGHPFYQLTVTQAKPEEIVCRLSTTASLLENGNDDQVKHTAIGELLRVFSNMGPEDILTHNIIGEPHASLSLVPGTARLRPLQRSPIRNMLVAGAWTDTGWPTNLESAVISSRRCVETIIGRVDNPD